MKLEIKGIEEAKAICSDINQKISEVQKALDELERVGISIEARKITLEDDKKIVVNGEKISTPK